MSSKEQESGLAVHNIVLKILNFFLLAFFVVIIIAPILILAIISFKPMEEYSQTGIWTLPRSFYLGNFADAIVNGHLLLGLKNVIILLVPSVVGSVIMGSMAAYVLSRFNFKINNIIIRLFLLAMVIPTTTTLVAVFNIVKALGVFNTIYAGIVLYLGASVIDLYIYMQFISKIPRDIDEGAMIDGASYFRIYFSIILPQIKPAIATVTILKVLGIYNDYFIPLTFMNKVNLTTITTGLYRFQTTKFQQWNVLAAGCLIVLIPTILIYIFTQKYIIAGATEGSVKG